MVDDRGLCMMANASTYTAPLSATVRCKLASLLFSHSTSELARSFEARNQ